MLEIRDKQQVKERVISLTKKVNSTKEEYNLLGVKARVHIVLDYSISMSSLYRDKYVQDLTERLAALAFSFDDNGSIPVRIFGENSRLLPEVTLETLSEYVEREAVREYSLQRSTLYAIPLNDIIDDEFSDQIHKCWLLDLFSKRQKEVDPVFVIFITDGNNFDPDNTRSVLKKASNLPFFVQFVGLGCRDTFRFLTTLDSKNASFTSFTNINLCKDSVLFNALIKDFSSFLKVRGLLSKATK